MMVFCTTLLPPAALGLLLLRGLGLRWRDDPVSFAAWAWLLGCLLLGVIVQLQVLAGFWVAFAAVLGPLAALRQWREGRSQSPVAASEAAVGRGYAAFVWGGVVLCLLFVVAGADRPCIEGDEGNIWSLKAKSLLVDWSDQRPDQFARAQVHNLHPDYPQLNPLLQAWGYLAHGRHDLTATTNRWLVQLCSVALFVAVAGALRRRLPPLAAAAGSALLLCEPEFQNLLRTAYADGMLALGLVVALDAFLRYRASGDRRFGWLAGLGLAFALWSKNETMLYLASAGLAAAITRPWIRPQCGGCRLGNLWLLVPAGAVVGFTSLWNRHFGMQSDLLGANPSGKSMFVLMVEQWRERVPAMLAEALAVLTSPAHAHVVFALLLAGAVLLPRRAFGPRLALPMLALAGAFVGIHVVYVGSFLPLRFHLDTSYARVTFQLLPAALVLGAALASDVVANRRAGHTAPSS